MPTDPEPLHQPALLWSARRSGCRVRGNAELAQNLRISKTSRRRVRLSARLRSFELAPTLCADRAPAQLRRHMAHHAIGGRIFQRARLRAPVQKSFQNEFAMCASCIAPTMRRVRCCCVTAVRSAMPSLQTCQSDRPSLPPLPLYQPSRPCPKSAITLALVAIPRCRATAHKYIGGIVNQCL